MTVVLTEPFDNLTKWTGASIGTIVAGGRTGTALQQGGTASTNYVIPAGDQLPHMAVDFWFKTTNATVVHSIVGFRAATLAQVALRSETNGALTIVRGVPTSGTSLGTTAAAALTINTWHHLRLDVTIAAGTAGAASLTLNSTVVLNLTGIDTKPQTGVVDELRLETTGTGTHMYDDLTLEKFAAGVFVKAYTGSAFVDAPVKVYNGTAFVDALAVKTWNGSAWV